MIFFFILGMARRRLAACLSLPLVRPVRRSFALLYQRLRVVCAPYSASVVCAASSCVPSPRATRRRPHCLGSSSSWHVIVESPCLPVRLRFLVRPRGPLLWFAASPRPITLHVSCSAGELSRLTYPLMRIAARANVRLAFSRSLAFLRIPHLWCCYGRELWDN